MRRRFVAGSIVIALAMGAVADAAGAAIPAPPERLFLPLREGRIFVAIGALHLQGRKGLLSLLRQDGYRITQVW